MDEKLYSTYHEENGIFIVKIGADVYSIFVNSVLQKISDEVRLVIIAADNCYSHAVGYMTIIAEKIKAKGICVICILKDLWRTISNGTGIQEEIEVQAKKAKEHANTIIIARKEHAFQDVIETILSFYKKFPDIQATLLAERFFDGGLSYYCTSYSNETIDLNDFAEQFTIESIRQCPVYMARQVLCRMSFGRKFCWGENREWGERRILLSYLQDYLDDDVFLVSEAEMDERVTNFGIKIQAIIGQFGECQLFYDEDGVYTYPIPTNKRLYNRIIRLLKMEWINTKRRESFQMNESRDKNNI